MLRSRSPVEAVIERFGDGEHLVDGERGHGDDGGVGGGGGEDVEPGGGAWLGQEADHQTERRHRVGQRDGEPEEGGVRGPPVTGLDQVDHRPQHHLQHTQPPVNLRTNIYTEVYHLVI